MKSRFWIKAGLKKYPKFSIFEIKFIIILDFGILMNDDKVAGAEQALSQAGPRAISVGI